MANTSVQFNGEVGNIESNVNKTNLFNKSLSEAAKETKYPSIKCLENLIDLWFPVTTTLIFSSSAVNPNDIYGGTWERTAKGKAIVGVDEDDKDFATAGLTLGEKKHQTTIEEMPEHYHKAEEDKTHEQGAAYARSYGGVDSNAWGSEAGGYAYLKDIKTSKVGSNQPHNNIQPSMTFYIWTRVA